MKCGSLKRFKRKTSTEDEANILLNELARSKVADRGLPIRISLNRCGCVRHKLNFVFSQRLRQSNNLTINIKTNNLLNKIKFEPTLNTT